MQRLRDRRAAGQALATRLTRFAGQPDVLVLALPRGGVPVGFEVARALRAPLDVIVVRKLGVPGHAELAMGAIAGGRVCVLNRKLLRELRIAGVEVDRVVAAERLELRRRELAYRGTRPPPEVAGKTVILVDDGLATGATMFAAISALERQHAADVVVAAPVVSREAAQAIANAGHTVVSVLSPSPFYGVGLWYADFSQTGDDEVRALLGAAARPDDAALAAMGATQGAHAPGRAS